MTHVKRLLIIGLFLLMPTTAEAYTQQQLAQWRAVGDQQWPQSRCVGVSQPLVVKDLPTSVEDQAKGLATMGYALGADNGSCQFQIVAGLTDYDACLVTVHELGHLAGHGHTVGGVMDPDVMLAEKDYAFAPCAQVTPVVTTRDEALNWMNARWQMSTNDCRRPLPSRARCWGRTALGTRIQVVVWRGADFRLRGGRLK